ncbi:MAG: hypothetical protein ACOC32_01030 [Nanoarchaeota archaeon]
MQETIAEEEFIRDPSEISKHLVSIAKKKAKKYNDILGEKKGFIAGIRRGIKVRMWYLQKYHDIMDYLEGFSISETSVEGLFSRFEEIADYIALNNVILSYAYLVEKTKTSDILTKEEERLLLLDAIRQEEQDPDALRDEFGHYALNPFELSAKRFNEYTDKEIKKLASLTEFSTEKTKTLKTCDPDSERKYALYTALREELRYHALRIVAALREQLEAMQKKTKKNIYSMTYEDVISHED